ncbi:MAG: hypothetical protein LBD88_01575 [Candidatus Peribacteria bacterium]|jgi:hypothetical protein|nr:hypothetical protein [Candidatus Peribacteria bacterium]
MEKIMKEKEFIVSTKCDDVRTKEEIMSYTIKFFRKSLSIANVYIKE